MLFLYIPEKAENAIYKIRKFFNYTFNFFRILQVIFQLVGMFIIVHGQFHNAVFHLLPSKKSLGGLNAYTIFYLFIDNLKRITLSILFDQPATT